MRPRTTGGREAGAVSLLFTAVFMSLVALVAVSFLYSLRYGHWPIQDIWDNWTRRATVENIQQEIRGAVTQAGVPTASEVRRCVIAGKVVYSNVDCRDESSAGSTSSGSSHSRSVKLYDSRGIEAPKQTLPAEAEGEGGLQLKDKALEKTLSGKK
ncbi:hypothetical protein [Undibacterium terreum]|uniref:Uncharacterized protein n=1 Tax=Undibacterium terreum TaxID=1224302 RepID=A0A916XLX5_9BURK|nr:hypothetical protein [Undibacterium terreum]GGC82443.1 hypothetical protein GCM10011396_32200 [Undibacterium terreum]